MSVPGKSIHSVVVVVEICCTETKSKTTKSKQMELNIFHQWRSSYQIISYHITSHHIILNHIPYHIISYHTISYPYVGKLAASHAHAVHWAWSWKQNFLFAEIKCCSQSRCVRPALSRFVFFFRFSRPHTCKGWHNSLTIHRRLWTPKHCRFAYRG